LAEVKTFAFLFTVSSISFAVPLHIVVRACGGIIVHGRLQRVKKTRETAAVQRTWLLPRMTWRGRREPAHPPGVT